MRKPLICLLICLLALPTFSPAALGSQAQAKYVWPVTGVQVNRKTMTLYAGSSATLITKVTPASRAYEKVTFTSEDPSVATVDADGRVTGVSAGSCRIVATVKGSMSYDPTVTAACNVTVRNPAVRSFALSQNALYLCKGESQTLTVSSIKPAAAANYEVVWRSANPNVARVQDGKVTGVAAGTTRIRATIGKKSVSCPVRVTDQGQPLAVSISEKSHTLAEGESLILTAQALPLGLKGQKITWESTRPAVATVDDAGRVKAISKGKTQIRAIASSGVKAVCNVTVKKIPVSAVSLNVSGTQLLKVGTSLTLSATVAPANASDPTVVWKSSNPAVAAVTDGHVEGKAIGKAVISAAANGKIARVTVRVLGGTTAKVTITAAGDITLGGDPRYPISRVSSQAYYAANVYEKWGDNLLSGVSSLFSGANNIGIANLECCLGTGTRYRTKPYVFQAPPAYAKILVNAGIDAVGHANNHAVDVATGVRETMRAMNEYGLGYAGNGKVYMTTLPSGLTVGMCAYSILAGESGRVASGVKALKKAGCDVVIVQLHWGTEFSYAATSSMRTLGRRAIAAGADLVLGHHQHVVSGIEKYQGKYIVYGLGTLSSSGLVSTTSIRDFDTVIYQQTFTVDLQSGYVLLDDNVSLHPVSMSSTYKTQSDNNNAHPVILTGADRKRVLEKIRYLSRNYAQTLPDSAFS